MGTPATEKGATTFLAPFLACRSRISREEWSACIGVLRRAPRLRLRRQFTSEKELAQLAAAWPGNHLDAWSDFEMLGYDTFTMPYTFPSIFTFVAYLLGPFKLYVVAGYEVTLLAKQKVSERSWSPSIWHKR